jgi:hypothetical protein
MAVLDEQYIDQPGTNQILHNITDLSGLLQLSASALDVQSIKVDNSRNSVPIALKFWNVASGSVTFGTTAPSLVFVIGPNISGNTGADGIQEIQFPKGMAFATACTVAATLTAAKANIAAPTNQFDVEIAIDS